MHVTIGTHVPPAVKTTVYTVPSNRIAKWNLLYTANTLGNNKAITVVWYKKDTNTEITIVNSAVVTANGFLQWTGAGSFVLLNEFDEIRVTAAADSDFSIIATLEVSKDTENT